MKRKNLFSPKKMHYILNKEFREKNCILCKIIEKSSDVCNLSLYHGKEASICLNLYPYNAGHLMIYPNRHIEDIRSLTLEEEKAISDYTKASLSMLEDAYHTNGFNIGYNIGKSSGASITHLHLHIVPRYPNELGFMDIISGTKLIVEDPYETKERLTELLKKYMG